MNTHALKKAISVFVALCATLALSSAEQAEADASPRISIDPQERLWIKVRDGRATESPTADVDTYSILQNGLKYAFDKSGFQHEDIKWLRAGAVKLEPGQTLATININEFRLSRLAKFETRFTVTLETADGAKETLGTFSGDAASLGSSIAGYARDQLQEAAQEAGAGLAQALSERLAAAAAPAPSEEALEE